MDTPFVVAATGHRPDKLGGYGEDVRDRLVEIAVASLEILKPTSVISGMALGWDQAVARAALKLGIPLIAAIPFVGQESRWPEHTQKAYREILRRASSKVIVTTGGYAAYKMQYRNEYMVNEANHILALWNGSSGGTANCLRYAQEKRVPFTNVWDLWSELHA